MSVRICDVCGSPGASLSVAQHRTVCLRCYDHDFSASSVSPPESSSLLDSQEHLSSISKAISAEDEALISAENHRKWIGADQAKVDPDPVDRSARCAAVLGIAGPLGTAAPCVLPHHGRHQAWTVKSSQGHWELDCPKLPNRLSLAQLRAVQAYIAVPYEHSKDEPRGARRDIRFPSGRSPETARWWERLHYDGGLLDPHRVPLDIPPDLSENASAVAEGIKLLLGLRRENWLTDDFTWAKRFAQAWTGRSESQVRAGLYELLERSIVVRIGRARHGRAYVYRLGWLHEVLGSEDAVADAFKQAFDATELEP